MADEQQNGALNPDLMGYPSVDALVNAKRASDQEAKKIADERDRYRQQYELLVQNQLTQSANPKGQPRKAWEERLDTLGIPVDAVREGIREEAQALVQQAFQPIMQGFQARTTLLGQYPEYQKFEADVAGFIQADPQLNQTYQRMYQADPVGAFEYAFLKFGESRRRSGATPVAEPSEGAVHAAIPTQRSGDARRTTVPGEIDIQEMWDRYQQQPNKTNLNAFAKARLRQVIPDEHLMGPHG